MDYFKDGTDIGMNISYVVQDTSINPGIASALSLVEKVISSDFILLLGDNLFQTDLSKCIDLHFASKADATIHIEEHDHPQRFGVVELDGDDVISLEEKPKDPKSNLVITGFYVFSPSIFKMLSGLHLSNRGEFELTDAIQRLVSEKHIVKASRITGWRLDVGYPEDLLEINKKYLNEKTHSVLCEVTDSTIIPPVYISKSCKITSSTIGPYVMIENGVEVKNSEIRDSVILENSSIDHSHISNSVIGTKSQVSGIRSTSLKVGDYSTITNEFY